MEEEPQRVVIKTHNNDGNIMRLKNNQTKVVIGSQAPEGNLFKCKNQYRGYFLSFERGRILEKRVSGHVLFHKRRGCPTSGNSHKLSVATSLTWERFDNG